MQYKMNSLNLKEPSFYLPKINKSCIERASHNVLIKTNNTARKQNQQLVDVKLQKKAKSNIQSSYIKEHITKMLSNSRHILNLKYIQINSKQKQRKTIAQKIIKIQTHSKRKQKKIARIVINSQYAIQPDQNSQDKQNYMQQSHEKKVLYKQIILKRVPPHRAKTQIVIDKNSIVLFGGIGCERDLTWAKINFQPPFIQLPLINNLSDLYNKNIPVYGHTMKTYKHIAYIYGGVSQDAIQDLTIFNLKTMSLSTGKTAPFRRKQHAAAFLGRYMIVYGGIKGIKTKNTFFYYDTQLASWHTFNSPNLPYLSHHGMVVVPKQNKKKANHICQWVDQIYVFGGKTQSGQLSKKLYRLVIQSDSQINCQQIKPTPQLSDPSPQPRYSFCFQYIQNGNILLYGGKQDSQSNDNNKKKGTFSDVYLFNTKKNFWKKQECKMDFRNSMATASFGGKVFVYGGFGDTLYANPNVIQFQITQNNVVTRQPEFQDEKENYLSQKKLLQN